MSTVFLILFFVIIILLIIIMFLLLKRLIFKVNQQSMDYFLDKLKAYDKLVEEKENKLDDLNGMIERKSKELNKKEEEKEFQNQSFFLYEAGNLTYKDEDIFKKMKIVDQNFDIDEENIIMNFFQNVFDTSTIKNYNKYCRVREIFTHDVIFDLMTKKEKVCFDKVKELLGDSSEILDGFMKNNKEFHLKKFISYLNKNIDNYDPYVYVYVGDKKENYNNLNSYIKTKYDESIFKGFKIIYRGKLYDYSI